MTHKWNLEQIIVLEASISIYDIAINLSLKTEHNQFYLCKTVYKKISFLRLKSQHSLSFNLYSILNVELIQI